jgi:ADP-dependent NAD(P)H-hydrate dehydratase / NAD(P)H-hydrate epimerase
MRADSPRRRPWLTGVPKKPELFGVKKENDMIPVVTKQTMRAADKYMIERMHIPSRILMENAAFGITEAVSKKFGTETRVAVVCGTGNNGGDGLAAARQLKARGYNVTVYLAGRTEDLKEDAAENATFFWGRINEITSGSGVRTFFSHMRNYVIIDALFGTGLSREVTGLTAQIIDILNSSGAYIIACDIPSGIDADTGAVLGTAIRANETVTFQYPKAGHLLYPGREYTGQLTIKEIGVTEEFDPGSIRLVDARLNLEKRRADSHKGSYGKLVCVAGSQGFSGAAIMCVKAALRAGAGLITAGIPAGLQMAVSGACPESMTFALDENSGSVSESCTQGLDSLIQGKDALAAGPGLSLSEGAKKAVYHMVRNYNIRKVFDADALSVIAQNIKVLEEKKGDIVLTPHPAEFARLVGAEKEDVMKDPLRAAADFASRYGVTILLKGATTIITTGSKTALLPHGTPGMAKGGSGDVLTGVIGSLMCGGKRGGMEGFPAALYGAYICAKAGEAAASQLGEYSMTAMDTIENIPEVMKKMAE